MTQQDFYALRDQVSKEQFPYKVVDRAAVKYVGRMDVDSEKQRGRNVFSIEGTDVLATDYVAAVLDNYNGFSKEQKKVVYKASGEDGIRDFRNYLAAASSIADPSKLAFVANPASHTVVNVIPVKDNIIDSDTFFDFAEMFMDDNGLTPSDWEVGGDFSSGIILHMDSNSPDVRSFADGEDTLVNSYFLQWNLGQIQLGRYIERLVCSNGATETVQSVKARLNEFNDKSIREFLGIPKNGNMLDSMYDKYSTAALTAKDTRASLRELKSVARRLEAYQVGPQAANLIAPYQEELNQYTAAGYAVDELKPENVLASMSVWELYNAVTSYASHTQEWDATDNRRAMLQGEAFRFLLHPRDIRNYVDVYRRIV